MVQASTDISKSMRIREVLQIRLGLFNERHCLLKLPLGYVDVEVFRNIFQPICSKQFGLSVLSICKWLPYSSLMLPFRTAPSTLFHNISWHFVLPFRGLQHLDPLLLARDVLCLVEVAIGKHEDFECISDKIRVFDIHDSHVIKLIEGLISVPDRPSPLLDQWPNHETVVEQECLH